VDFTLRPYRAADFDRLWQIDQACFAPSIAYSQMELSGFITRRNAITLVAEDVRIDHRPPPADPIIGFAIAQPYRKHGRILTLDVLPEARRSGLGSTLLQECEARLRLRGCTEIYLETAVNNEAALKLYHKLGYRILRTLPSYYHATGLDAFLLGKEL
jgi:[ribosomal protein S18]-alanine N-acetyltransferase